jgi:hypothetical protein
VSTNRTFLGEFPMQENREFRHLYQGNFLSEQGNGSPETRPRPGRIKIPRWQELQNLIDHSCHRR